MKRFPLLLLTMFLATSSLARARDWKIARVLDSSETDVSDELRGRKNILHYTIQTDTGIYFVDYTYTPRHADTGAPAIAVGSFTKIAIEGKTAYILDETGREVKLRLVKKPKNK